ncbi:MAG TPA: hypothetical protein DCM07_18590 [Planctomycetaceae bacterium]|nr:hypothetical protein [Gimesia sp.]HAH46817.1 hypothetical protein [Planctomycetaceae bacterium]HBL41961.1 hypothetical protein [Planctomycetaceae bacterium]|tara:strand:+ start:7882 stop:8187 length:306 start_codon:yes stop_codon:yes gene_type:complete
MIIHHQQKAYRGQVFYIQRVLSLYLSLYLYPGISATNKGYAKRLKYLIRMVGSGVLMSVSKAAALRFCLQKQINGSGHLYLIAFELIRLFLAYLDICLNMH